MKRNRNGLPILANRQRLTHSELTARAKAIYEATIRDSALDVFRDCEICGATWDTCQCQMPMIELYYAAALPQHMIAIDRLGGLHMLPLDITPDVWDRAVPYVGHYDVTVMPDYAQALYGHPSIASLAKIDNQLACCNECAERHSS